MGRPVFTPVFEEAEAVIRDRMLQRVPDTWRKEPGDFIYDAVASSPLEVKTLQANQDYVLKSAFAQYAEGQRLDNKLAEVGLTRAAAIAAIRTLNVNADAGVAILAGHTASTVILDGQGNPVEFTVNDTVNFGVSGTQAVTITCKIAGTIGTVPSGSQFIFLPPIPGVRSIADGGQVVPGADTESDASAWERYDFKVRNPDTGGNKNDYVRWAREVVTVGRAKCIPLWNGPGTVKVLLVGTNFTPALPAVVADVQEYLDPGSAGLGEGKAPCGAQVTAVAATGLPINIVATVIYHPNTDKVAAKAAFTAAVTEYLKTLAFAADPDVVIAQIGSRLIGTYGIANYSGLTLNVSAADVTIGAAEVATLGTVTLNE